MIFSEYDAVVVGGGIVGSFTALNLAKMGRSVCLIDKGLICQEASGRAGGGVRQQYRDPAELPLAMEAVKIWSGLSAELGQEIEYRRNGCLRLLRTEGEAAEAHSRIERERAAGLDVRMLDEKEVRERVTVLAPDLKLFGGTLCPTDGTANPLLMARALSRALKRVGVVLRLNEPASRFLVEGGRVKAVQSQEREYRAAAFVNAAGPWARELSRTIELDFPIKVHNSKILITEPLSPVIPGFVSFNGGYLRQALDGNIHLGVRGHPVNDYDKSLPFESFLYGGRHFPEIFPFLRRVQIIRGFGGLTTWTPDGIAIIDRAPGLDGLFMAAAFCGHGFCLGPVVGRLLAEWIVEGKPSLELSAFAWTRFEEAALKAV